MTDELEKFLALFDALSRTAPSFATEWEHTAYLEQQRRVIVELAKHQAVLPLVRDFCKAVDDPSRMDADISVTLRRAIRLAPVWADKLRAYIAKVKSEVPDALTGDPLHDLWAKGTHMSGALQWETNAIRHSRAYETDFRGYIRERD